MSREMNNEETCIELIKRWQDQLVAGFVQHSLEAARRIRVFNVCQNCGHVEQLYIDDREMAEKENAIDAADSYLRFLLNEHLNSEHRAIL